MPATKDRTAPSRAAARPFVLWREVLTAYAAPALMAGTAGVVTGQADLTVAAVTSIAGTSAVVAFLVGAWLRHGGRPRRWTLALPRLVLTVLLVVATAACGGGAGVVRRRMAAGAHHASRRPLAAAAARRPARLRRPRHHHRHPALARHRREAPAVTPAVTPAVAPAPAVTEPGGTRRRGRHQVYEDTR